MACIRGWYDHGNVMRFLFHVRCWTTSEVIYDTDIPQMIVLVSFHTYLEIIVVVVSWFLFLTFFTFGLGKTSMIRCSIKNGFGSIISTGCLKSIQYSYWSYKLNCFKVGWIKNKVVHSALTLWTYTYLKYDSATTSEYSEDTPLKF